MPSEVMLMVWASKPLHAPQANNHSIMIKLCSKTNDIFQTPEMSQTVAGNAVV